MSSRRWCNHCQKVGEDFKVCSSCRSVRYCTKDCQVKDWNNHKRVCTEDLKDIPKDNSVRLADSYVKSPFRGFSIGGKIPHCQICSDTDKLKRTKVGIMCEDCLDIQDNMR